MTHQEYERLKIDLIKLSSQIPLHWRSIQNDSTDSMLNIFKVRSFDDLELAIANFSTMQQEYFKRRWFLWKCSACDEFAFCLNDNVVPNPNFKDQSYDFHINPPLGPKFDLKATVIPQAFRNSVDEIIKSPEPMIKFFYDNQSRGVRECKQNRLFLIHHSKKDESREMYLRSLFVTKEKIFKHYVQNVTAGRQYYKYDGVISDVISLIEEVDGKLTYNFRQ